MKSATIKSRLASKSITTGMQLFLVFACLFLFMTFQQDIHAKPKENGGQLRTTTWTAGSKMVINEDLEIPANDTLIIEHGVTVEVNHARIIVRGTILAQGLSNNRILFTSSHDKGWQGFEFLNCNTESIINYCIIENAKPDVVGQKSAEGLIIVSNTQKLSIKNSWIRNNEGGIFYISGQNTNVYFDGNTFHTNQVSDANVSKGIILATTDSYIKVDDCLFRDNTLHEGGAISLEENSMADVINSRFRRNVFHEEINNPSQKRLIRVNDSELYLSNSNLADNDGYYVFFTRYSNGLIRRSIFTGKPMNDEIMTCAISVNVQSYVEVKNDVVFKDFTKHAVESHNSTIKINDAIFKHCESGEGPGAVLLKNSSFELIDTRFYHNRSDDDAGAVSINNSNGTVDNAIFLSNRAGSLGGAVHFDLRQQDTIVFQNNYFFRNEAMRGGAIHGLGGAVQLLSNNFYFNNHEMQMSSKEDENDQAIGGAIYLKGSAVDLIGNKIGNNFAIHGGGIYLDNCQGLLKNNFIRRNRAEEQGGGMLLTNLSAESVDLTENIITRNRSGSKGAGIAILESDKTGFKRNYIADNRPRENAHAHKGGGVYVSNSKVFFKNDIVHNNRSLANNGGGVYIQNTTPADTVYFLNANIVKNFNTGVLVDEGSNAVVKAKNTLAYANVEKQWVNDGNTPVSIKHSNVRPAVPEFVNPALFNTEHVHNFPPNFDSNTFYLLSASELIDKGDPAAAYHDKEFPPSQGTDQNDIGATGGPYAKIPPDGWNIYNFIDKSPEALFEYEVIRVENGSYTIKYTDKTKLNDGKRPNYYWFWGDGTDSLVYHYYSMQSPIIILEREYNEPKEFEVMLFVETTGGVDMHAKTVFIGVPGEAKKPEGDEVVLFKPGDENTKEGEYLTDSIDFAKDYEWEIDADSDIFTEKIIENQKLTVTWNEPPLGVEKTALIRVRGRNDPFDKGPWSPYLEVTIKHEDETSIENVKHTLFSLYPNPTKGLVHVYNNMASKAYNISVMDYSGHKLLESHISGKKTEHILDISSYPAGLYFVVIQADGFRQSFKVVKQ